MTAACPACVELPPSATVPVPARADLVLHLPDIHCAACIASVERTLGAEPGVREARVNLSLRRVFVSAAGVEPEALIDALAAAGHRAQRLDAAPARDTGSRDLLMRMGVAGFAMMNVMLLSVAVWSGAAEATAHLFHLISAAIALPAVAFSGRPFFASALSALRAGRLNMDVPISLAILLAAGVSFFGALVGAERPGWFDAALALTFFLLIGRYLDHAGRRAARSAAADLAALEAPQAIRLEGQGERVVRAADLAAGDLIRVRPGDRLPADGVVEAGASDLDRAALTGETQPCAVAPGGAVAAGEVNLSGPLTVRVTHAGRDTSLARLAEMVATAESQRSRHSGLADRAAAIYAPLVHILGAAAFIAWFWATRDGMRSLDVAISVLVITCPCALGLAVPAVSTVTTARLFRQGLLVKSRTALERLAEVDMVVFDKTGTLTTGEARLRDPADLEALALAAGLARGSAHPYSRAICAAAAEEGVTPAALEEVTEIPGSGVEGLWQGARVRLGRPAWLGLSGEGVALSHGAGAPALFTFEETLRPEAAEAVAAIRASGRDVALLSGDAPAAVARVAEALGIEAAEAGFSPQDKADWLSARAAEGRRTLMVGDGLNDTGALTVAHASLAPASALDAARSAADVVLLSGRLDRIAPMLATARGATARMRQNIALAGAYNIVAVPLALVGLATPFLAALAMSASSVTVSLNAIRGGR
ncbi:heavy metal translocating P-type ATPase [Pseudoroseicyclus tamaricis]|uniref:Cadmium-translocating P-type ATPase n=1 Tax=Pseudoroseicyclus tamaricis TaxID=2705421 RepID=A0A6B2JTJ0_9RHOB|nr:heavy metal translocating P-type ATPase [Pseudoroseicyclus tamaricis]NDV01275.1 cadmium-translocating P-type ATPase [Pseudoroseicyclus tamaricis]